MEAAIDKIKEAIVPLSSAFYSGETLGANICFLANAYAIFNAFLGSSCLEGNRMYKGPLVETKLRE